MIIIRVELHSARTGEISELARMRICNDGTVSAENPNLGNYEGVTYRGRSRNALDMAQSSELFQRSGKVENFPRLKLHVWNLVARMLNKLGYK